MNDSHRETAAAWHTGESSRLYAYAATGDAQPGLDDEIEHRLAWVEHATTMNAPDQAYERQRLLGLLRHVEPLLAQDRARAVGREHARLAAVWWHQDELDGRPPGEAAATARETLRWINGADEPPTKLGISPGWHDVDDSREISDAVGLPEPDVDDTAAHERWETTVDSVSDAYTEAFAEAFWEAVADACRTELARSEPPRAPVQARVSEHHLAHARVAGAEVALAAAAALELDPRTAAAVTSGGWHGLAPPALTDLTAPGRAMEPRAMGPRSEDGVAEGQALVAGTGAAVHAVIHADVTEAWLGGRDTVWVTALWAKALHTLGHDQLARRLQAVCEDRGDDLVQALDAARSELATPQRPDPPESTQRPDHPQPPVVRRADERSPMPEGWKVVPVARNDQGDDIEVIYDPGRYDILVAHRRAVDRDPLVDGEGPADPVTRALLSEGWQLHPTAGHTRVWTRDRDKARPRDPGRHNPTPDPSERRAGIGAVGGESTTEREGRGADAAASVQAALARLDRRVTGVDRPGADSAVDPPVPEAEL